jgi:hypothetical protein
MLAGRIIEIAPPGQIRQYGGTAIFTVNKAVHRVIEKGIDESLLGRLSWTRFKGKRGHTLRIIMAYRPNLPHGPYTVYAQQNAFFHPILRDICPRQAFLVDLIAAITLFMELCDHVILLIDGNANMKNSDLCTQLHQLSLREVILEKHGLQGPATHKRNATSSPINGVWMSPGLKIEKGGYFASDEVIPSDHRCLWADITFMSAFGHNMAPISKRKPKRLNCRDPRLVDNFIHLYHQFASPLKLFNQVQEFEQKAPFMSKTEVIHRYEELDALCCEATAFAERRCRKLRMGQVAFSPELNLSRLKIKAWLMLLAKVRKRKISSRLIKRTLKKANISSDARGSPEEEIQERLKAEYKLYYQLKGDATQLQMTALEQLAAAIAEKGDTDKEKVIKALHEREQQRKTAKK